MKKYMNTVFPIIGKIDTLFNVSSKDELRKELTNHVNNKSEEFELKDSEKIDDNNIIKNAIPGAKEIPLERFLDAGFSIKVYLKDDSENCIDDKNGSGVLMISIQHEDPNKNLLVDGFSMQFDAITEIEIATLNTLLLDSWKPGIFGEKYDINEALKVGSLKIRDILLEREEAKKIREEKIETYKNNPELQKKDTKKLLENLRYKFNQLKDKTEVDKSQEFTKGALKILASIAGINNIGSFDEVKNIPIFKEELEKGGSFSDLLNKFCDQASQLPAKTGN